MMMKREDLAYQLSDGGLFWFTDLASKDSTLILPLVAVGLSYSLLEFGFRTKVPGGMLIGLKRFCQGFLLMSAPMICTLPSGVFCYWIPSNVFGLTQMVALRNEEFQKLIGLPPPSK